jgi:hypothetical protein
MITDGDETVLGFNIDLNSDLGFQEEEFSCSSTDQHMPYQEVINQGKGWHLLLILRIWIKYC